jgi:glycosidase
MMNNWRGLWLLFMMMMPLAPAVGQRLHPIQRMEPPHWYVGMADQQLQLLVYGRGLGQFEPSVSYPGVRITGVERVENPNYLFVNLEISEAAQPGRMEFVFRQGKRVLRRFYELQPRRFPNNQVNGFGAGDLVYLIMPDRFANGNPANDVVRGMQQTAIDRRNDIARHGGDLDGIRQQLPYIAELGATAIWLNPVQENDQPRESYHGYAMTDLYRIDPRLGTNESYVALVQEAQQKGIKVIMDLVHNHLGDRHWLIRDLPAADWVNQWPEFTRTTYRAITQLDPYAAAADSAQMVAGWFDTHMPDLNQRNPLLARYLIQNNLWWVEYAGLNGYRLDTYAYPDNDFMNACLTALRRQYPDLGIVGEVWVHTVTESAWYVQGNKLNPKPQTLPGVTDFPLYNAIRDGLNENFGWDTGLRRIYYTLAQDVAYGDASQNMIFLDNHDISRAWAIFKQDMERMKMAHGLLLTLRGIPQLYYGSELLFGNYASMGGTNVRQDMPGGWPGDPVNKFTREGRSQEENELFDYISTIAKWRQTSAAVARGSFKHYVPEDEVYVYFRQHGNELVMVLVNSSKTSKMVSAQRFASELGKADTVFDVLNGEPTVLETMIEVPARSVRILDIRTP